MVLQSLVLISSAFHLSQGMIVFVESLNYDMEVSVSTDTVSKMLVTGIGALGRSQVYCNLLWCILVAGFITI